MMTVPSSLPALRRVSVVSLRLLRVGVRVRIRIFPRAFAIVVFSDAFDAEAGFSLGRLQRAALFSCILCVCWDSIPRLGPVVWIFLSPQS